MVSTRNLPGLPGIDELRRLMQSLAILDAILSPEWQYRYFSFNSRWGSGEQIGSMRDGSGDHYIALFNAAGAWLKGFAHESPMSPFSKNPPRIAAGVLDGVPSEFAACLTEPAFVIAETTFCIWRQYLDQQWHRGPVALPGDDRDYDGSVDLLHYLDGQPTTYQKWAEGYYERNVSLAAVQSIYAFRPLDQRIVSELDPAMSLADLAADLDEIGYRAS